jgi:electron transfer flavoprotein alpha subunit
MAGCSGSKCLVAINKDPEAQIFKWANLGVVGDYRDVLPPLIKECRALRN